MKQIRWQVAQFFEKQWWNNYLKKKDAQQYIAWKSNYWKEFLQQISFHINKDSSVLDVGCGPAGIFILSTENIGKKWTAIDPLLKNYDSLPIFKQEKYPSVCFVDTHFEAYENTEKYDTIFCINAINHFINIETNLQKLNRLLQHDGEMVLSLDTHNYRFLKWILHFLPFDILHPHQYTEKEYEKMFLDNGFKIEKKKLFKKEFIFSYYVYILLKKV